MASDARPRDPHRDRRRIIDALAQASRTRATQHVKVPIEDPYWTGPLQYTERDLAPIDVYDDMRYIDWEDLHPDKVRLSVFAPGYNNRGRSYIDEIKRRPLRGAVLVEDDLYRKTGLHPEAWRDTGKCVLYQMQKVMTTRDKGLDSSSLRERFTLDQLEVLFDEAWEEDVGDGEVLGPAMR